MPYSQAAREAHELAAKIDLIARRIILEAEELGRYDGADWGYQGSAAHAYQLLAQAAMTLGVATKEEEELAERI